MSAFSAFFGFNTGTGDDSSKFASKKSKKKKQHQLVPSATEFPISGISGPSGSPKTNLYRKLSSHQQFINHQLEQILTSLGQQKDRKTNYSVVFTDVLMQLSGVISTTQQCLTKDVYEKNASLKSHLNDREHQMYASVALLVKWADFGNRDEQFEMELFKVQGNIDTFRDTLNEIVGLVAENVLDQAHQQTSLPSSVAEKGRRKSFDCSYLHRVDDSGGDGEVGGGGGGGGTETSHLPPAARSMSVKPRLATVNTDSGSSTSGDSEVFNRRSGSSERQDNAYSDSNNTRMRSKTEADNLSGPSFTRPHPPHIPLPPPPSSPPKERLQSPPRLASHSENGLPPPLPARKHVSPVHRPYQEQTDILPDRLQRFPADRPDRVSLWISHSEHGGDPPPLPLKRRVGPATSYPIDITAQSPGSGEESSPPPPPLPLKRHRQGSLPVSSLTTASLPPSFLSQVASSGVDLAARDVVPRPPMRMESIPALRPIITAAHTTTPPAPPKPPRNDRVASSTNSTLSLPQPGPEYLSAVKKIEEYNVNVKKASAEPGAAPPIPPKKRTVMMYNQLIQMQDYKFDESIYQPFNIRGSDIPPPVPPKRRARRVPSTTAADRVRPLRGKPAEDGAYGASTDSTMSPSRHLQQQPLRSEDDREAKRAVTGSTEELSSEELDVEDEKINHLEVEKASAYLVFNKEEEGLYTLRGGPIDALIAYAASTTNEVSQYPEAFLLTYYTFITPEDLVDKLIYRLRYFYGEGNCTVWQATTSLLVRLLYNLRLPLQKEAEIKLIELVHSMLTDGNLKFAQLVRNALVEKLNQLIPNGINDIPFGKALSTTTSRATIQDFEPEEIAVQMTVLDAELFYKVDVSEMFYWAKEQSEEKSPRLTLFTMHFNNVSQWCRTKLLERDLTWKQREKLMMLLIHVMKALRVHNNFNSYLAVLSAIESASISRLDWSERIIRSLEEPRALIDSRGSFKNYRQAFAQTKPPCIPYIGLYLQDLTSLEEQSSKLEDGVSINFGKRWKQFKSVDHIRFAQSRQYNYAPDPKIFGVFNNFELHSSDEELWKESLEIKPSARQRASAQ